MIDKIDNNYVKFGIVDVNGQITDFGKEYGLYAIMRTERVNENDPLITYENAIHVEPCYVPQGCIDYYYDPWKGEPLTVIGIRWFKHYIKTHSFNPYIYSQAKGIDMRDVHISA